MTPDLPFNLDLHEAKKTVTTALQGAMDGELFLEDMRSESMVLDRGCLKMANASHRQGMGLRGVLGEHVVYTHTSRMTPMALTELGRHVQAALPGGHTRVLPPPQRTSSLPLYEDALLLEEFSFQERLTLLRTIEAAARDADPRIREVSVSLFMEMQTICIVRPEMLPLMDRRPLVRLGVTIIAADGSHRSTGTAGYGGRDRLGVYLAPHRWQRAVNEAVDQALLALGAPPAPAGEMPVVLGAGWPGILLHEAVGHGLEGDFNRKKTSVFTGRMGERVAAPGVTVIDDGTLKGARGSLHLDDEGTPTSRTVLIEDGRLVGYMQDRLNARLMGVSPTGNGRRESYAHMPLPRMTNTFMEAGPHRLEEMIQSLPRGIYAKNFSGGQVDITSGKFVFSASEAFLIENGKIKHPVQGASLIGDGLTALQDIIMIGNDFASDPGIGTCGKEGQSVPVGVGQPSLLLKKLTVGGAAA